MEIRKLNMLRGIAAMIVVVGHFSNETNMLNGLLGQHAGQLGVMLFFILSGFLMSYLYLDRPFNRLNVARFAWARIARVVPLFVLVVLLSYMLWSMGLRDILYPIKTIKSVLSHLLLLSGVSVLWTIPPEIQFYILFVPLWWLYSRRRGYLFVLLGLVFAILTWLEFPYPRGRFLGLVVNLALIRSLPYFAVGVLFGRLYAAWQAPARLRKNFFVAALLLILLIYPEIYRVLIGPPYRMWVDLEPLLVLGVVFFAVIFLVPEENILLSNPIGDFLGKISYSLYLLHLPILGLILVPARHRPSLWIGIFIVLVLVVSSLSYTLLEAPARKALRSLGERKPSPAGPTSPIASVDAPS